MTGDVWRHPRAGHAAGALAGAVTGALAGTAVAITCMPCDRSRGYFVPTAELVLADLTGRRNPHPVFGLARRLTTEPPAVSGVLVLFDDLDVTRNWLLPPGPPRVTELWPAVQSAVHAALPAESAAGPIDVALLSEWLYAHGALAAYEGEVQAYTAQFLNSLTSPVGDAAARRLMTRQLARRRRLTPPGDVPVEELDVRVRAAGHLANYAVQGRMMVEASPAAYLVGGQEEAEKMSVFAPGLSGLATGVVSSLHRDRAEDPACEDLVAAVIPARHADLRASLPLYLEDLAVTPGAVVPGLAADIVAAIGKVLTPGTVRSGATEVRALNRILGGGPTNRDRADTLLAHLLTVVGAPPDPARLGAEPAGETARKLFGQLAVRWEDEALTVQHRRHMQVLADLSGALPEGEPVALALTGSLTTAPGGWWHPFLSDIDVMPLRAHEPSPGEVERLHRIYEDTPRPPWVYLNTGACVGVAGTSQDPRRRLFVADHLPSLASFERRLLSVLLGRSRLLAGDAGIYEAFRRWLSGTDAVMTSAEGEGHP